jgi:hypothetical protein
VEITIEQADALDFLQRQPEGSLDLVFGSPPYEHARTYGIGFDKRGQAWVDWMVELTVAALRACRGVVAWVVEGTTKDYRWSSTPALLMADLHRRGITLRRPPIYKRFGIPGSGGKDWLRCDHEWIVCATRGGRLPWSDPTACGHPPKYGPGGEMSHRLSDGARVNQWGGRGTSGRCRRKNGEMQAAGRPSHRAFRRAEGVEHQTYTPPTLANPGTVIDTNDASDIVDVGSVGGNRMGHTFAHENEAPFSLKLAEFFVKTFAPPGGVVADVFSGSGTTAHACLIHGRNFKGCDVRASQVELAQRRLADVRSKTEKPDGDVQDVQQVDVGPDAPLPTVSEVGVELAP